ncbi:hypothetical protein [Streptomyces clavuligerus]|uniref:DUF2384 domain-containing protein n=1 Tax=Streptomyces clavuligerus TaxID=1901 RepID=E2PXN2_STRCL|nr:hypothetical protein [Streptomyces clavuligerus]ANW19131.1 hypothetical protein BB341_13335 [Streptomyces clavuligerus]AXU13714.1 hypothetical protein D1794_13825 [Streptomyces clavuligerus]EFG08122.1 Hypothetical protein SCLAV_3051 [Streptomyces clavuligerus]MBY6303688.1 hypothetical protein [Streptomyces clavuligerus]QCS06500.1 hypothetical protein CRV15_13260 [Streptomyces clavuligerus]
MRTGELLGLLRSHQPEIHASFTPDQYIRYQEAVRGLQSAGSDPRAVRVALRRIRVALRPLPPGSELAERIGQSRSPGPGAAAGVLPDADELAALVRLLDSVEWPQLAPASANLFWEARNALLSAPSRGADALDRESADDPAAAGLIRLTGPGGSPRYPEFQFDTGTGGPLPVVQKINRMILADQDPWGAASWWLGRNPWLDGTPAELLGRVPDETLTAAARALTYEGEIAW